MNIHLVVAHPEVRSFNFALHNLAMTLLRQSGFGVYESDLYAMNFCSVATRKDVIDYPSSEHFQLVNAQRWGLNNNKLCEEIKTEQTKLLDSEVLILQFPIWWGSFPAILKGWIDRVFSSGFAYGDHPVLAPSKVMFSVTTGGASDQEEIDFYSNQMNTLSESIFGYMDWTLLPTFFAHGVERITQSQREALLMDYQQHLTSYIK